MVRKKGGEYIFVDVFETDKKYQIIYADPPWSYQDKKCNGACETHYKTMTIEDICKLPIKDISDDNCILFLWTTYPMLPEALKLIEAWGFKYKSIAFQWIKLNKATRLDDFLITTPLDILKKVCFFGLGRWTRGNTEPCLIATKGKPKRISASISQLIFSPLTRHSAKPPETRDKIIDLIGDLPKIELFARDHIDGWDSWGNEVKR